MMCGKCKHHQGDGFPYGDVICNFDNKYKHEYHDCDYPEKLKSVMILPDKECANCKHTGPMRDLLIETTHCFITPNIAERVCLHDVCSLWQSKEPKQ